MQKQELEGEKLIEEEKAETGAVKLNVLTHYLKSMGILLSIATILFHVLGQIFNVGSSIWLSIWSSHQNATNEERDIYLGVYGALGFVQSTT